MVLKKYLHPRCFKRISSLQIPNLFRKLCLRRIRRPGRKTRNQEKTKRSWLSQENPWVILKNEMQRRLALETPQLARKAETESWYGFSLTLTSRSRLTPMSSWKAWNNEALQIGAKRRRRKSTTNSEIKSLPMLFPVILLLLTKISSPNPKNDKPKRLPEKLKAPTNPRKTPQSKSKRKMSLGPDLKNLSFLQSIAMQSHLSKKLKKPLPKKAHHLSKTCQISTCSRGP